MRIAFVTQPGHAVMPAAGSIELWAEAVAERLAERHEVRVYASAPPRGPAPDDSAIGYRFVEHGRARLLTRALRLAWRALPDRRPFFASLLHPVEYWLRVAWRIRKDGADVVHIFNYSQALPILRRLTGAKVVLHMHCEWLSQLDRRMIDGRLEHADLIVGCSDHITDLSPRALPRHCGAVSHDLQRDRSVRDAAGGEAEHAPGHRDPTAQRRPGVAGEGSARPARRTGAPRRQVPRPALDHPRGGVARSRSSSRFGCRTTCSCSSSPRFYGASYLEHITARMSPAVAERVTFVDRVPHAEALRFYRDADIFVYPSLFESFAIPPVEAMAAGLPVVASSVGGMRETIVHEGRGFSSRVTMRLSWRPRSPASRCSRRSTSAGGRHGAVRAELFSSERVTTDVESAFGSLLDASAPFGAASSRTRRPPPVGVTTGGHVLRLAFHYPADRRRRSPAQRPARPPTLGAPATARSSSPGPACRTFAGRRRTHRSQEPTTPCPFAGSAAPRLLATSRGRVGSNAGRAGRRVGSAGGRLHWSSRRRRCRTRSTSSGGHLPLTGSGRRSRRSPASCASRWSSTSRTRGRWTRCSSTRAGCTGGSSCGAWGRSCVRPTRWS